MKKYSYVSKVTFDIWIEVEAESEAEAEVIAVEHYNNDIYKIDDSSGDFPDFDSFDLYEVVES